MTNVLSIVLAGGAGKRLQPLTLKQAKPALTFVQRRRIIDFVLSNLWHSGFKQLLVLTQYKPDSLQRHIQQLWQPLFGRDGGLQLCQAAEQLQQGTAGAVAAELAKVRDLRPDVIAVLSADHVYKMDYRQMLAVHQQQKVAVTVAAIAVPLAQARQFGIFAVDNNFNITGFIEKPQGAVPQIPGRPGFALASMGNYLFNASSLYQLLDTIDAGTPCDFGHDLLPALFEAGRAGIYDFSTNHLPGEQSLPHYWRDVGTLAAYFHSRLDVLQHPDWLDGPEQCWPILATSGSIKQRRTAPGLIQRLSRNGLHPLYL
ncbi:NTP transferase domain-containing protein [Rheinheimera sp. YQF-2]|uniref:NTP transferase domain-containing protein n=1 Tax=Rheinheimera lutimaris TaxID=2740584 RepID=A0A7Y5EH60_9GAMM|nr:sugar phosphate nucleotidyltransferase [Rheinheimera lutimaris]NRQ41417.1 NTP transferase domain-containing protein [Rheinheimera lutimaris]